MLITKQKKKNSKYKLFYEYIGEYIIFITIPSISSKTEKWECITEAYSSMTAEVFHFPFVTVLLLPLSLVGYGGWEKDKQPNVYTDTLYMYT